MNTAYLCHFSSLGHIIITQIVSMINIALEHFHQKQPLKANVAQVCAVKTWRWWKGQMDNGVQENNYFMGITIKSIEYMAWFNNFTSVMALKFSNKDLKLV